MKYQIDIEKDRNNVSIRYDITTTPGGAELIATFQVYIDGEETVKDNAANNTRFFGTIFTKLEDDSKDVSVSFSLTSNTGFQASDTDTLRGEHRYDSANWIK